jgi:hypothetical protein
MAAKRESDAHKKYMQDYNRRQYRAKIEAIGTIANPAGQERFDWETFYVTLYAKLGLGTYLIGVLAELRATGATSLR